MNAEPSLHPPSPADDVVIRATRPNDYEGIAALGNMPGYRWGTLRLPHQTPEATRKWIENMGPGNVSLVVEKSGRIIGSGGFERHQGRRSHVAYLGMGLHDDFHGQGIGTRLLRELIMVADDWMNLRRIELTVYVDNTPAIALYKRHGFEIEGTHKEFAFRSGAFVDAYAMARIKP
ncbi:GNAT family N-acetyltransferase [Microvirga lotononidis]|uniref:Acetyltransferase, ribosomal protein N-acetylase n=1 Tax=Microvirga lotononidis TaxID=864069 RepID=I4YPZ0_9HYPH|nr:GNAT family N-acetyltransferase [Microvirga lotononidis]EIM26032.1 acetyltransferase, ribosomal protein N-acetylase [Microvirga lotononidis]WQO25941.1 GNAT family N-acetyltransferase [Microvirga lotononidis]